MVAPLLQFVVTFWWLVLPLAAIVAGGLKAIGAASERRAERRLERYRIQQQTKIAVAEAAGRGRVNEKTFHREMRRLFELHDRTEKRWLDYELDVAKLLDFPMMTDMREPLTVAFHKAKRRADFLRPDSLDEISGDRTAHLEYRDAVQDFADTFHIAEAEAIRRRRSDFSSRDRQRLERAQHLMGLALDSAATAQERQSAYYRACRELDGLIALPTATRASIEQRIAGEIEA